MDMTITADQIKRTAADWSDYAGEPVKIDATYIGAPVYAFGSELACLRIYRKMLGHGKVAYSENMQTWYYVNT